MDSFKDKVAVVTGGAGGIGLSIAQSLASEGANLVLADVDGDAAAKSAEALRGQGARCLAVATDVTDRASVESLANAAAAEYGGVDLLINNAGVYVGGPMRDVTEDDWRFVLDVNLDGVFRVGQIFSSLIRDQGRGGHIVNTASIGGFMIHPEGVTYGVSKFGVVGYSEALRMELEADGVGVSTLCPGPIATELPKSDRLRKNSDSTGGASEALTPHIADGMKPVDVGPIVVRGIRANAPYIFTHDFRELFAQRFDAVLAGFDLIQK